MWNFLIIFCEGQEYLPSFYKLMIKNRMQKKFGANGTSFLAKGGGTTADLLRSLDWAHHPLGPCENWPRALKTSLNILFHSQHPMFIWWGPELYQFYNDAYLPSFGLGKHPLAMGQRGEDCWPEIWPIIKPQIQKVMSGEGSTWNENQLVPIIRNGKTEEVYWTYGYSPIFNDEGSVGGTLVVCTETTKQVHILKNLNEMNLKTEMERSQLQTLFFQAPMPLAMLEGPDHRFLFANESYKKYFLEDIDFLGKTVAEILPEAVGQGFIGLLDKVYSTGERHIGNETPFTLLGTDYYLNFVYEPIRNSGNEVTGILAAISDITEQVTNRKKLEVIATTMESERHKFATLFSDAATSMALTHGPTHVYEFANASYQNLFDGREFVGKALLEALPELLGQPFPDLFDKVFKTGEPYVEREAQAYLKRTENDPLEERYFDQTYTRVTGVDGKPYGVFIHCTEVTDRVFARRELQESQLQLKHATTKAEQANAAKSAFLANMSHEIRTPLGAVMGFVDLLKDEGLSRRALEDYIAIINRNSNQLVRIIDDILDLSKVEAGMMTIENIEFSIIELLTDLSSLMHLRAKEKGIVFDLRVSTKLPNVVSSDPTRLRQILSNIVGNAIKFTERGRVELDASYDNGLMTFEIHDTGCGISKDQEHNLFQPFSQADISVTRKFGGTGLGLVLTRRLSEAMGGDFKLKESEIGKGSTFVTHIKINVPKNSKLVSALGYDLSPSENKIPDAQTKNWDVLLVEDSPDNQTLISIFLKKAGAAVDIANNGAEGVEMALKKNYDLIFMDIQMPVMDGFTALKILRSKGFQKPIVALTAHAMKEERERCMQAGFTSFLSKPLQRESIVNLLNKMVK